MKKKVLHTERAPGAIGPYSQGIKVGDFVYTSGQLPIDMVNGKLETEDIERATELALMNVGAVLGAGGASMEDVVKVTVFLTDLADFAAMNAVYARFFPGDAPARSCVQAAALPKGAAIEIEAVALAKETEE